MSTISQKSNRRMGEGVTPIRGKFETGRGASCLGKRKDVGAGDIGSQSGYQGYAD